MEKDWQFEISSCKLASQVVLAVKNLPANAGDIRDSGLIPGSGRSPGGGHGNPLQYSCREYLMDRGVWQVAVHRVAQSWTRLKQLSTHAQTIIYRMDNSKRSKQSILKEISPEYSLEGLMLKLKLSYSGHLICRPDSLEKTLMLGKTEGRRRRGRQRMRLVGWHH